MTKALGHIPVMLDEVLDCLDPRDGGLYVDGTYGGGSYTEAMLKAAQCSVCAFDLDRDAITRGQAMSKAYDGRLQLHHGPFSDMDDVIDVASADGVALDIGVSSFQLGDGVRGFSFSVDGPLDMRMGQDGATASDIVNTVDEDGLSQIFKTYGEERRARQIAKAIVKSRAERPITRTIQLADLVERTVGRKGARIHPATRIFQALRIYVNRELDELAKGLAAAERVLKPAGRLVVVAFDSLGDRIVKRFFTDRSGATGGASRHRPMVQSDGPAPTFESLRRSALKPSDEEVARNPRARSARLRTAIRTDAAPWPFHLDDFALPGGLSL